MNASTGTCISGMGQCLLFPDGILLGICSGESLYRLCMHMHYANIDLFSGFMCITRVYVSYCNLNICPQYFAGFVSPYFSRNEAMVQKTKGLGIKVSSALLYIVSMYNNTMLLLYFS